ncbi:MAG: HEAT repeat domain-containing protein [Armatimonadota bacterium]|nr:HEAT repeat domain-containing protein [Armatimonadota bacterium]
MRSPEREIQDILNSLPLLSVNAVGRLRQMGRVATPGLAIALQSPDPAVRAAAARAIGRLTDPAGIPALEGALEDPDSGVRLAAVGALAAIPGTEAVEALGRALRARHALVRDCAARALARRSLPTLRAALDDPNPKARAAAVHGVGYYARDRRSIPVLEQLLSDADPDVRRMAVRALGWVGAVHREALRSLAQALAHPDAEVRAGAAQALGRIGDPAACEPLLALLKDPARRVVLEALRALGSEDVDLPGRRVGAGDWRAVPALAECLRGDDVEIRLAALGALASIFARDPRARSDVLVADLIGALEDPDPRVRAAAAAALGESGAQTGVTALAKALRDAAWQVRAAAASALGSLGGEEAMAALRRARKEEQDPAVARQADMALQNLRARTDSVWR